MRKYATSTYRINIHYLLFSLSICSARHSIKRNVDITHRHFRGSLSARPWFSKDDKVLRERSNGTTRRSIACHAISLSALKRAYREELDPVGHEPIRFTFSVGDPSQRKKLIPGPLRTLVPFTWIPVIVRAEFPNCRDCSTRRTVLFTRRTLVPAKYIEKEKQKPDTRSVYDSNDVFVDQVYFDPFTLTV